MSIGMRIKEVRKVYRITQKNLADELGLKQNTIASYEIGKLTPSDRTIRDICRIFGVPEVWLRTGKGEILVPVNQEEEITKWVGKEMDQMNKRIAWCISYSGLTKMAFAKRLNVSQPFVSRLASGVSLPSNRTIVSICREFGISEVWLRTGEGEPILSTTKEEEIENWVKKVLAGNDSFKKDFLVVLSRLDDSSWEALSHIVNGLAAQSLES